MQSRARKLISDSPFEELRSVRVTSKLPRVLSENEILRLIRGASTLRDRAVLEVLYASGCRIGGLCSMDLSKVSFAERKATTIAKGGNETTLYLNESAVRAIKRYLPVREFEIAKAGSNLVPTALFLRRGAVRLTTTAGNSIVQSVAKRAKLGKRVNAHMIRHTFATHVLNRGADLYSIMQFLGHRSIESTVRYLQVATARLSEVHRKYHPRR
jgi:integrase/recombinase XerD